jgi:4-hydroxy-tetrahydrodipicolinate synthase
VRGGIWSAVLTPVDPNGAPDAARAVAYYRDLLQSGCDGINVLGTTGEAMSLGTEQRLRFMEAIASSGLPMDRVIVGTGAASLDDAARLTSRAFACGFAAALVMPPFFFRDATDDGIAAFFGALLARANAPPRGMLLYNFPRMSGIAFHPALVERLLREFPGTIAGMKDSSNDVVLQTELFARHRDLAIFPGAERDLAQAKARGVAGCISGSVALWPALARDVWATADSARARTLAALRAALDGVPFVPAMRYLTAESRGDAAWERAITPLVSLSAEQRSALDRALEPFRPFVSGERPT